MSRRKNNPDPLSRVEKRATFSLASIYALRMMGLFMILPVFALYAENLEGVTPTLIGLAIGIYGLTQAVFQIPFGMMSDRVGRKTMICIGLVIFAIGSVVAAMATDIFGVIMGRALQGSGAIAAVVMALTADLTREENRLKAMAVIGMSIGVSFAVSLVLGPVVNTWIGVSGIFWMTAVLAIAGIFVVIFVVPKPLESRFHRDAMPVPELFKRVILDKELLRLDAGIMILHMMLTASFVVIPFALRDYAQLNVNDHWEVYLPVMLLSMAAMVPFIIMAESKRKMKQVFIGAILTLVVGQLVLAGFYDSVMGIVIGLFVFFMAFNILEASLPSLVAKISPPAHKGTAMGAYSSSQFMGAFLGGVGGGALYQWHGLMMVFLACAAMALVWFSIAASMHHPRYLSTYMVRVGEVDEQRAHDLVNEMAHVQGVAEVLVIPEDGIAYLKVDLHALDREALHAFSISEA